MSVLVSSCGQVIVQSAPVNIRFTALGLPQPAGSKSAFRNPHTGRVHVVDANASSKPWQAVVAAAAHEAMAGRELLTGPLEVTMRFYVPRPKGHYGTGRNANVLKPSAPRWPAVKPDVLKLARGVEDALSGQCWRDDAQIVVERLEKRYGPPGVEIEITPL